MTNSIKIAFHIFDKKFIHIDNASNGLSCNCMCLKCNERLEAVQGKARAKHFRHHSNVECMGAQETALHELGKQILLENTEIRLPKYGVIKYSRPLAEMKLETIRPDISATLNNEQIFFEIYVSHAVNNDKEKFFIYKKYKSVEIDLSSYFNSSYSEVENMVLNEISNKKIFYWGNENEPSIKNVCHDWISQLLACSIGVFIFIGLVLSLNNKKRR